MKTLLITGGTAGIGKVTATTLAKQNFQVVIVGRNKEKTAMVVDEIKKETANPHVEYLLGDLSVMDDARRLAKEFNDKYENLHVLINNAGCVYRKRELTKEGFEKTFATNHLSHFILTNGLLDKMKNTGKARIVNVSSISHFSGRWIPDDINMEKNYKMLRAYSNSKLCNVLFTKHLAKKLSNDGITVNCLHPGLVRTNIGGKNTGPFGKFAWGTYALLLGGISEEKGARTSIYLASSPEVENSTGEYFDKCKAVPSSEISNNPSYASELWEMSWKMANL